MDEIKIEYGMRNDYMFRAVLQENQHVLKGLVCALLHFRPNDVKSITVTNPIKLGEAITDKEFILDLAILLNDEAYLNLEMQVINYHDWPERSLSYLCRSFDRLNHGDLYSDAKPAIHIGFLDYTPFPEAPEFYSSYAMKNLCTHRLYSSKFQISVVDLTQIRLATEEDKAYGIDKWAALFRATTWEELKMIAQGNEYLTEASESIRKYNSDEVMRQRCEARERAELEERLRLEKMKKMELEIEEMRATIADLRSQLNTQNF